ncbi:MAG: SOS response-associated peptidase [Fimbriimonadaceae bacterium]|nr:SOS response-associated peptidase [Fimbriimonadaceae bacterium]QYK54693.1 MAG: SOS response-associated peptidase [Fimbriimonadaceae bacterium]
MCARYVFFNGRMFVDRYGVPVVPDLTPRYNIAPTQEVPAVVQGRAGREYRPLRWGLVPSWARDPAVGQRMINARCETLLERQAFKDAFLRRRCLLPVDGFYEWAGEGKSKRAYYISWPGGPRAFAGLFESWQGPEGLLETCTVITTEPNEVVARVHDRMPAVLHPEDYEDWLEAGPEEAPRLMALLRPLAVEETVLTEVGRAVGNPRNEGPSLIEPVVNRSLFD